MLKLNNEKMSQLAIMLSVLCIINVRCELFTSLADMEQVFETESVLINNLNLYISVQEEKLEFLRRKVYEYQREHDEAARDVSSYLTNPINAYLLTKRLTSDWRDVEKIMTVDVGSDFIKNISNYRDDGFLKFPSDEDLNGAATALTRLQDTYNLDTNSLARGEINGVQYSTEMNAGDCFELGRQSYLNGDHYHTVLWMEEAIERLGSDINRTSTTRADILEYLAFSTFKQGKVQDALTMTDELLILLPNHERALGNKYFYEKELVKSNVKSTLRGDDGSDDLPKDRNMEFKFGGNAYTAELPERKLYEMACRGELFLPPSMSSKLTCRYETKNIPFLMLAPLKLEEAYKPSPYIVIYHDVISDNEIEFIKNLAKPRFRRATVQNYKTGELEVAQYRISKSAWLKDEENEKIRKISQRVEDMSGLSMKTAEELQVVNYGIGGHYEPHYDFARTEETNAFKSLGTGNRIATLLFYLSDVQQGGATVFPVLRIALWPKKGSAAFWHNLHKSGEGDYSTRHAACPVLTGSKWVANKWIHEIGQELIRPCDLEPSKANESLKV